MVLNIETNSERAPLVGGRGRDRKHIARCQACGKGKAHYFAKKFTESSRV